MLLIRCLFSPRVGVMQNLGILGRIHSRLTLDRSQIASRTAVDNKCFHTSKELLYSPTSRKFEDKGSSQGGSSRRAFILPDQVDPANLNVMNLLVYPFLFALVVGGGTFYLTHSETSKKWRLERAKKRRYRMLHPQGISKWMKWWDSYTPEQQTMGMLTGANIAVFLGAKVSSASPFILSHFTHSILNPRPYTLLTSTFTHFGLVHLLFNMIALNSFGSSLHRAIDREGIFGVYIAGGLTASMTSHIFKLITKDATRSVGASGAVFAMVAASTCLNPDMQMQFIFFPWASFSAGSLLPALVAFDLFGCATMVVKPLQRFRMGLDHPAHLGGVAFGYAYMNWLKEVSRKRREERIR